MIGHPHADLLRRFAHAHDAIAAQPADLDAETTARVAAHLGRCARCRREVDRLGRVRTALRVLDAPGAAPDVLARVLARRAAGERMIVPAVVRLQAPRTRAPAAAVAASVLLAAAAIASVATLPRAVAAMSELDFVPHAPRAGAQVRVVYRAGSLFAGEDTLVLRGRYRTAASPRGEQPPQHPVAVLARGRDGAFHGALRLPDSVVYAAFAVEDRAGERIDHNRNRSWTLELYGVDGRPELAALQQRLHDLAGGSWEARLETARRMTELYPADPRGWAELWPLEDMLSMPEDAERLSAAFTARFTTLHETLAGTPALAASVVAAMIRYGNPRELNEHWMARLQREHGRDPRAVAQRMFATQAAASSDELAGAYLALAEQVWTELAPDAGAGHGLWIHNAIVYARRVGDAAAVVRWTDRMIRHGQPAMQVRIEYLDVLPELAAAEPAAVDLIRRQIEAWREPRDSLRPLHAPRSAHARQTARLHRSALGQLGRALLVRGDTATGLAALRSAAAEGWDAALFRTVAHELLAAGDTLEALRHLALLSVDPDPYDDAELAELAATARLEQGAWPAWRAEALTRFRSTMLADAAMRPLRRGVTVLDRERRAHSLETLLDRRPTVIAFMAPGASAARAHLPAVEALHDWLAERGVNFVVLTRWRGSAELRQIYDAAGGGTLPVFFDAHGEARDALHKIFVPSFFIVDAAGLLVFEHLDPGSVRSKVAALLPPPARHAELD